MNRWLVAAGLLSAIVSAVHIAVVFGGARWYRFFGAGARMALLAERRSPVAALITIMLAFVFLLWSMYAFSGAGVLPPFPLLRPTLCLIASAYLVRGALLIPTLFGITPLAIVPTIKPHDPFTVWSSLTSFAIGLVYAVGIAQSS